jgi:hypothetical protein
MNELTAILMIVVCLPLEGSTVDPPKALSGCWRVGRSIGTTNIEALSDKQIKQIIGRRISYGKNCAKSGKVAVQGPNYEVRVVSETDFFPEYYIPLKQIGISKKAVTEVTLKGVALPPEEFVGNAVYLGGKNPVIVVEGAFFELERVQGPCDCGCQTQ